MMRSKGQSQSMFMKIMASPFRALGRARDAYVRSITTCGQSVSYGNPMDPAGRFSSLSRSQSVATSRSGDGDDYAELLRAASARTMVGRIDMDLILKQQQLQQQQQHRYHTEGPKGSKLPKSSSVGMGGIDEETPYDTSEGGVAFVAPDSYPRSKSYAVGKRNVAF
uniref:Uncharacterized protein n=1 Tax=Lotus japonicus TaxID=34305 RepID=I3SGQ2_LOTJA|nr:unknown [Lotus japonicus]